MNLMYYEEKLTKTPAKKYDSYLMKLLQEIEETKSPKEIKNIENYIKNINHKSKEDGKKILALIKEERNNKTDKNISPKLKRLLDNNSLEYNFHEIQEISKIERILVRVDFYGIVERIDTNDEYNRIELSKEYLENKKTPSLSHKKISLSDLREQNSWKTFRKFPNFIKIEEDVIKYLNKIKTSQEVFEKMSVEEFLDTAYESNENKTKNQAFLFQGQKSKFVQNFIKRFEDPFTAILNALNVDKEYIKEIINYMQVQGCCYNIVARNKKGGLIKGPSFTIDHNTAVRNANSLEKISDVNAFSNLTLVIEEPINKSKQTIHNGIFHGLRTPDDSNTYKQICLKNKECVLIAGLSPALQISFDYKSLENNNLKKRTKSRE